MGVLQSFIGLSKPRERDGEKLNSFIDISAAAFLMSCQFVVTFSYHVKSVDAN